MNGRDTTAHETSDERTADGDPPLLGLSSLNKHFDPAGNILSKLKDVVQRNDPAMIRAVDGVDMTLSTNQVQGIVGESGCGKTTLLRTLMGLYEPTSGELAFEGVPVSQFDKKDWKEYRRRVQMVFQDPFNSLDPKFTTRETLVEPLKIHDIGDREKRIHRSLEQVGLNPPEQYLDRFPSQLSGGEKQRVSIARALVLEPDVLLADEIVSMLDVSSQAAILKLLEELTDELGVSVVYISHDLSTVSYVCDRVNVMYLGRIIESAPTKKLIDDPKHPYTQALIKAIPIPDPHLNRERTQLQGDPGNPVNMPNGCRFKDRCPERMPVCDHTPKTVLDDPEHEVACHLYYEHATTEHETSDGSTAKAETDGGLDVLTGGERK